MSAFPFLCRVGRCLKSPFRLLDADGKSTRSFALNPIWHPGRQQGRPASGAHVTQAGSGPTYINHASAIDLSRYQEPDPARSLARFPPFTSTPPPGYPPRSWLLVSHHCVRSPMRSSESTPILLKHSQHSSISPPRPFFLAYLPRVLAWSLVGFILVNWFNWVGVSDHGLPERPQPPNTQPFVLPKYISRNLGAYSPWYPVQRYKRPSQECEVTQVSRQLASDCTSFASRVIEQSILSVLFGD